MQILTPGFDFSKVATSLSLATANYKPVPVSQSALDSATSTSTSHGRVAQAQSSNNRPESSWGLPSVLHTPDSSSNGRTLSSDSSTSGKTVGSHGCTILDDYSPKDSLNVEFPSFNKSRSNMMRYREQMGVNVGSWFVLESWMAPSMFKCASGGKSAEFDFLQGYGTSKDGLQSARARLEKHWDTWVTEKDFKKMKEVGVNTVRMPIGYWSAGPNHVKNTDFEPYASVYENAFKYVKRAIHWADKYDIGVLVDLHAAYGAQNDQAHSGFSTGKVNFYSGNNQKRTTDFLLWLTAQFANVTNVVGIELLNEPQNNDKLWPWYGQTMDKMRKVNSHAEDLPFYFHDAFNPNQGAAFAKKRADFVVQDTHSYYVYTKQDQAMSANKHTSQIKGEILASMQGMAKTARGNMIVGEWSCALNPNSLRSVHDKKGSNAQFCQAQTDTYRNATAGALFWSWTMENCKDNAGWCFKAALPGYMDGAYNVWGFSDKVSNKTIAGVSDSMSSVQMPNSYSTIRTSAGVPHTKQASTCSSSSSSSSANSNSGSNARVAKVHNPNSRSSEGMRLVPSSNSHSSSHEHPSSHSKSKHAQLTLSRVGFTEQYLSDTIKKKFNSGLKKLEKELVKKVEEMVN
ncbi:hypothetical protein MOBT1_002053 [Malassezia obtusa]|uniref:Glycoside hydrolase family 5 domain-containing protein n=1 Tax=Malassezia obtusa TaxID=76774 RepID=A0AAF0ITM7_9BASI|nr:hypothetical protein MOBT1_002053 [Malassezia obtusa]